MSSTCCAIHLFLYRETYIRKVRGNAFLTTGKYLKRFHFQKSLEMSCIIDYFRLFGHLNDNIFVEEEIGFRKNLKTEKAIYE
jgi:hypothetical protein